jgi:hypothetical protein
VAALATDPDRQHDHNAKADTGQESAYPIEPILRKPADRVKEVRQIHGYYGKNDAEGQPPHHFGVFHVILAHRFYVSLLFSL